MKVVLYKTNKKESAQYRYRGTFLFKAGRSNVTNTKYSFQYYSMVYT